METQEDMAPRDADLALERRVLHIRQAVVPVGGVAQIGPTKNGRSRAIHGIYPSVLAALREHKARQNERQLLLGGLWICSGPNPCPPVGLACGIHRSGIHRIGRSHVIDGCPSG